MAAQPVWRGCSLPGNSFEPCTCVPWAAARRWQDVRRRFGAVGSQYQGALLWPFLSTFLSLCHQDWERLARLWVSAGLSVTSQIRSGWEGEERRARKRASERPSTETPGISFKLLVPQIHLDQPLLLLPCRLPLLPASRLLRGSYPPGYGSFCRPLAFLLFSPWDSVR